MADDRLTLDQAHAWYPQDDAVHGFAHIQRVYGLCRVIGQAERADMEILLSAALLHDAQGSHPGENARDDHHLRSAEFAGRILSSMDWPEKRIHAVQHCIRAHRYRKEEKPASLEAEILFDADKLDVIGAIGVVRALAYAIQSNQPVFAEPSHYFLETLRGLPGEPHSAYHEYLFKLQHIASRLITVTARRMAMQRQRFLDDFFLELACEMRANQS